MDPLQIYVLLLVPPSPEKNNHLFPSKHFCRPNFLNPLKGQSEKKLQPTSVVRQRRSTTAVASLIVDKLHFTRYTLRLEANTVHAVCVKLSEVPRICAVIQTKVGSYKHLNE